MARREGYVRRRFFIPRFSQGKARLEGDAAHHLSRVLRAERGQVYELSDGRAVFLARVEGVERDAVEFTLLEPVAAAPQRLQATLLLAVFKFDRFEWALEKATELGAERVVPLAAERSEKALVAAAGKRSERWRKILLESAQQARCLRPPELESVTRPADAFRRASDFARVLLSERAGAPSLRQVLQAESAAAVAAPANAVPFALAVGPEGGWTDAEFASASAAGFAEASLGERILRTETAVVAGLAAGHLFFDL
jgi:16S rRNA (uracil1498-N3)-methyltransferase